MTALAATIAIGALFAVPVSAAEPTVTGVESLNGEHPAKFRRCGSSPGSFEIGPGIPPLYSEVRRIVTRNVRCGPAKRFAHRLFFRQPCIYCDASDAYDPGDWIRFRGFRCRVTKGDPQTFHCRRGGRRINFKTATRL